MNSSNNIMLSSENKYASMNYNRFGYLYNFKNEQQLMIGDV